MEAKASGAGATFARAAWLIGLAAVALQAAAFFSGFFGPWLDSDCLYPHVFAADLLDGRYPLSGWTLSRAPYLLPDMLAYAGLLAALGSGPFAYAAYVTLYGLALALLVAWSLESAGAGRASARLAGVFLVNLLLASRGLGGHTHWLAWLLMPGFHGGALLAGLAQFALWAGPPGEAPGRARRWAAMLLLFATGFSDTLVFTQFVVPLALALALAAGGGWRAARRLHALVTAVAVAAVAAAALRLAAPLSGWISLSKVVSDLPTPGGVLQAGVRMAHDVATVLVPGVPVFSGVALLALLVVAGCGWSRRRTAGAASGAPASDAAKVAGWFAAIGLLSTTLLPVASRTWVDHEHGRWLLPWLVMPFWWACLATAARRGPAGGRVAPVLSGALAALFATAAIFGAAGVRRESFRWPYPEQVAAFDAFLPLRGHTHGLGKYWHGHVVNTLGRAGLRFNQLRPDGRVLFWNNNAFHRFDVGPSGTLSAPLYSFIVMADLDAAAIEERYGKPAQIVRVGDETVWLYDAEGARRITAVVDEAVRARTAGLHGASRSPVARADL